MQERPDTSISMHFDTMEQRQSGIPSTEVPYNLSTVYSELHTTTEIRNEAFRRKEPVP